MLHCTVGVLAYNEEQNICQVLQALTAQQLHTSDLREIVVVASGCTDRTVELARAFARLHPLVRVEVQRERAGKAAAINRLITIARGDVIVLAGADTLPDPMALEHLLQPFRDPQVGMTGARVVPLNNGRSFLGFTVQLLWHVHHRMALRWPKLGELVAFRNVIAALPVNSATDEVSLEALITAQGYRLAYAPDAIVYNQGPQTVRDFVLQRRRIFAGHLAIASAEQYVAASMPIKHLLVLLREMLMRDRCWLMWLLGAVLLECWARLLGTIDWAVGHSHHVWRPVRSTKQMQSKREHLTLVTLSYKAGSVRRASLLRSLRRARRARGTLVWWDEQHKQVLLSVPSVHLSQRALDEHIADALADVRSYPAAAGAEIVGCRVVQFPAPYVPDIAGQNAIAHAPDRLLARSA